MINVNQLETKPFTILLAKIPESELVRLLDMIEILIHDFQQNPLHQGESIEDVAAAHQVLEIWNDEVKHILMTKKGKESYV